MNAARPMRRDEADQMLTGIGATYDRVAAAMYAIDVHPAQATLRGGAPQGATGARWQALRPELDLLWAHFATLGQHLEQARALRARFRPGDQGWADLTRLLCEPSILAESAPTAVGLPELAEQLERRSAAVTAHLSEVDASVTAVSARLGPVTASVEAVLALATELGEPAAGQDLRVALDQAQMADLGDPLTAAPGGRLAAAAEARWARLATEAEQVRRELLDQAEVRADYPRLRAALGGLVDDLAAAEAEVAGVHERVQAKIADPGLAPLPQATAAHRARLAELDRLQEQARTATPTTAAVAWRRLIDDLHSVEQSARQARDRARQQAGNADALLARRDELRGRLAAYRAKAAARGLAEDPDLTIAYARARELLFTAPCDLRAATRCVHDYQQTLAAILASATTDDGRSG